MNVWRCEPIQEVVGTGEHTSTPAYFPIPPGELFRGVGPEVPIWLVIDWRRLGKFGGGGGSQDASCVTIQNNFSELYMCDDFLELYI